MLLAYENLFQMNLAITYCYIDIPLELKQLKWELL